MTVWEAHGNMGFYFIGYLFMSYLTLKEFGSADSWYKGMMRSGNLGFQSGNGGTVYRVDSEGRFYVNGEIHDITKTHFSTLKRLHPRFYVMKRHGS